MTHSLGVPPNATSPKQVSLCKNISTYNKNSSTVLGIQSMWHMIAIKIPILDKKGIYMYITLYIINFEMRQCSP